LSPELSGAHRARPKGAVRGSAPELLLSRRGESSMYPIPNSHPGLLLQLLQSGVNTTAEIPGALWAHSLWWILSANFGRD
ncbi:hypothetical protein RY27_23355, partial [Litorilinea aerophila]